MTARATERTQTEPRTGPETAPRILPGTAPRILPETETHRVRWRASSYSNAEGGNCVEVAHGAGGTVGVGGAVGAGGIHGYAPRAVPVRDGKRPHGPALLFGTAAWSSFVAALKAHEVREVRDAPDPSGIRERLPGRR